MATAVSGKDGRGKASDDEPPSRCRCGGRLPRELDAAVGAQRCTFTHVSIFVANSSKGVADAPHSLARLFRIALPSRALISSSAPRLRLRATKVDPLIVTPATPPFLGLPLCAAGPPQRLTRSSSSRRHRLVSAFSSGARVHSGPPASFARLVAVTPAERANDGEFATALPPPAAVWQGGIPAPWSTPPARRRPPNGRDHGPPHPLPGERRLAGARHATAARPRHGRPGRLARHRGGPHAQRRRANGPG